MEKTFKRPLIDQIATYENLLWGFRQAAKKCKKSIDRCEFVFNQSSEIFAIKQALDAGEYKWGPYTEKTVIDPKIRIIHKAPFRDRVVHQAIFRVVDPFFERYMIHHSYACRENKGTGAALRDVQRIIANCPYALKLDASKYFQTVDHERLKQKLRKVFYEPRLVTLLESLIDSFNQGIPIGNLTSQLFANWYLNDIDHFIKRELKVRYYFRYMDDLLLFGNDKPTLWEHSTRIQEKGFNDDKIVFAKTKTVLYKVERGVPFLGYWLFPNKLPRIQQRGLQRFKDRLKKLRKKKSPESEIAEKVAGWYGHARFGLRKKLAKDLGIDGYIENLKRSRLVDL